MPAPSSRHATIPSAVSSPALTVEVWIERPEGAGPGGDETLLAQWREPSAGQSSFQGRDHRLFLHSGAEGRGLPAFCLITESGPVTLIDPHPLPPGTHHVAGTYDGKTVRLFVDAREVVCRPAQGPRVCDGGAVTVGGLGSGQEAFSGRVLHAALFGMALTPCQIASKHLWHRLAEKYDALPEIELDVYHVLDGRETLRGRVRMPAGTSLPVVLKVRPVSHEEPRLSLEIRPAAEDAWTAFELPLSGLGGGIHRMEVRDARGLSASCFFAIREEAKSTAPVSRQDYGAWLRGVVDRILELQTVLLRGESGGAPCVTTDLPARLGYRSLAYREGNTFRTGRFPGQPFDYETFRMDHEIWPVLDGLSALTGEPRYRELVDGMLEVLKREGFDPRSGLLRLGEESDFDVLRADVCAKPSPRYVPTFKPVNSSPRADMHLDRFWKHLPTRTHRWLRATYYGHVTDPASMDFNRVTFYGFDDSAHKPALARDASFCGFEGCAASLIRFWVSCWVHAGDRECLRWARQMTDKWRAVQHPETGLAPNFFGAAAPGDGDAQQPGDWAEARNAAQAAGLFLRAAADLRRRPGADALAADLQDMGRRLAIGVARHSYDPAKRYFHEHLHLDGRLYEHTARYCFRTQVDKEAAVLIDPLMEEVPVFSGVGFYRNPNFYDHLAGTNIPYDLAGAALLCPEDALVGPLRAMAAAAVTEADALEGAFTPEARWTFRATGWYIEMCLRLFQITRDPLHRDQAKRLADREIAALETVRHPDWWRLRERTIFLDALLHLCMENKS